MKVTLTNTGTNPRIIYDASGKAHNLAPGKATTIDLNDGDLRRKREQEMMGSPLKIGDHRPEVTKKEEKVIPPDEGVEKARQLLADFADNKIKYQDLLKETKSLIEIEGRPKQDELLELLRRKAREGE